MKTVPAASAALALVAALVLSAPSARAAAADAQNGVTLRIATFDGPSPASGEKGPRAVDAGEPLTLQLALSNMGEARVRGTLAVWINEDWTIDGPAEEPVVLEPGEQRLVRRSAVPGPRVVPGLYPVHAVFDAGAFALRPTAVFRARPARVRARKAHGWTLLAGDPPPAEENAAARRAADGPPPAQPLLARVELGAKGLFDAAIGFAEPARGIVFDGFDCAVDGKPVETVEDVAVTEQDDVFTVDHRLGFGRVARATVWAEGGALRVSWSLIAPAEAPGGAPRFTRLAPGPCSHAAMRVYAGDGNVLDDPGAFRLAATAACLSTRHAAADYPNGLSLLQATDVFPDALECDPARKVFALAASDDAVFTFVPSAKGACDAARRYAALCEQPVAPAAARLAGRLRLDDASGPAAALANLLALARAGVADAVYVLRGDALADGPAALAALRRAASAAGFELVLGVGRLAPAPLDPGFSYDDVAFADGGAPLRAADAFVTYPAALGARLEDRARALAGGAPDGLFLAGFIGEAPFACRDREGRFCSAPDTLAYWNEALARARAGLRRKDAPILGAAGADAFTGLLDGATPVGLPAARWFGGARPYSDAARLPWHDFVSHGRTVLYGGGADRAPGGDEALAATVVAGRAPLADAADARRAVATFWLLRDVCAAAGRAPLADFAFDGANIHRQHAVFAGGAEVWANFATNETWRVGVRTLPARGGFFAAAPDAEAAVISTGGKTWAYAKGPSGVFVDSRGTGPREAGGVKTDGAVWVVSGRKGLMRRMMPFSGPSGEVLVTPLPGSGKFRAVIDPERFGFRRGGVKDVVNVNPEPGAAEVRWTQKTGSVIIQADGRSAAYRILFK